MSPYPLKNEREADSPDPPNPSNPSNPGFFINTLYLTYKNRWLLVLIILISVGFQAVDSYRTPRAYRATAVILPEIKSKNANRDIRAAVLGRIGLGSLGEMGTTPVFVSLAMLKSIDMSHRVLVRYDYFHKMGIRKDAEMRVAASFRKRVKITRTQANPAILITVQTRDPIMSSDIANTYVHELDKLNRDRSTLSASRFRRYVENRLAEATVELEKVQQALMKFQETHNAFSISLQAEATIEVLSELEAKRVALEVEKGALEQFFQSSHVKIEKLDAQIDAVRRHIDGLKGAAVDRVPISDIAGKVSFYIPLSRIPDLNFNESRLVLQVKAKAEIVKLLATQLEKAKLEEKKDLPTIHVIDWASPPKRPFSPNVKKNVMVGGLIGILLGIVCIQIAEAFRRINQQSAAFPQWQELKGALRFRFLPLSSRRRK